MARLALVSRKNPDAFNINTQRVASYLADISEELWSAEFRAALIGQDYIDIWYWFDEVHFRHHVAIFGDWHLDLEGARRDNAPLYREIPARLFGGILLREGPNPTVTLWQSVRLRFMGVVNDVRFKLNLPINDPWLNTSTRKIVAAIESIPFQPAGDADLSSPDEEEWNAILILVSYFKRIPAVPIPKAADILGVDERTIRNRLDREDLEGIPRLGTIWVTKRSIKAYIQGYYKKSHTFDLWAEMESNLKLKLKKE